MKIMIKIIAFIYMYSLMWMIDLIFLFIHFIIWAVIYRFKYEEPLITNMTYKKDLLGGALNYNWLMPFQYTVCKGKGDCDKFAIVWKWNTMEMEQSEDEFISIMARYSIIPINILKLPKAHVVLSVEMLNCYNSKGTLYQDGHYTFDCNFKHENRICSNDNVYTKMTIEEYIELHYNKDEVIYVKMPY